MEIRKSRKYHVNMGNYEWAEFSAEVVLEDVAEANYDHMLRYTDKVLDEALEPDIKQAHDHTAESESFVHLIIQPPRRGTR